MKFYRIAAFCLISLLLPVHLAQADSPADSVQTSPQAVQNAERLVKPADTTQSTAQFAEWEKRYIKETRITIENNVKSLMDGLKSSQDLSESVKTFHSTWEDWTASRLFVLENDRDIDVYGNLYSLQVMCRTLRLASEEWCEEEGSSQSSKTLEQAQWLEKKSRRFAESVAEIIRRQSYSSYLPRRIEIMQQMLPYVDICYKTQPFSEVLKRQ